MKLQSPVSSTEAYYTQLGGNGLAVCWAGGGVMAGHLHLKLRHCASAIVADSNISYCQMLLSRDTVLRKPSYLYLEIYTSVVYDILIYCIANVIAPDV